MAPRSLSEADVAAFRERLIDVAERLFAERGPEAVTIRHLAAELGVSPMTPYRYFKDKDAILAAARARAFDRHADALERVRTDQTLSPTQRSNAIGAAYVRFALDHPAAYRLMFDTHHASAADHPELMAAMTRSRATMTAHLRDLASEGLFSGDPELVGHMYWAGLHGPIMLELAGMLAEGPNVGTLILRIGEAVTRAVMDGG